MKLIHDSPGVAARVRRIIPRAVVHQPPRHELGSRIVRIVVVVEEIGVGKSPGCDRVADHGPVARQLILVALHVLHLVAETEVVRDVEPREVRLGSGGSDSRQFTVRRIGQSINVAKSPPACDFRIEDQLRALAEAKTEEQRGGERRRRARDSPGGSAGPHKES